MQRSMKWLAATTLCLAAPAMAGEVNGNGDSTPIRDGVASSICAFSGLNDDGLGPSSQVQAWGALVASVRGAGNVVGHPSPGIACRG